MIKKNQKLIKRRLPCWYENLKSSSGTEGMSIKGTTKKEELQIQKPNTNAINVEVLITSSKTAHNGKMRRARERQGNQEDN